MNNSDKLIFDDIINEAWEELRKAFLYWTPNISEEEMAQAKNNFYMAAFLSSLERRIWRRKS